MTTSLRLRRGTTTQHSTFTGGAGEVTVDTTKKTVVVHDGTTVGGSPLATEAQVNSKLSNSAGSVATTNLADSSVTTVKIADANVTTAKIADNNVTGAKLETSGVTAGTYGSSSAIPVVTVDNKGRVTGASTAAVSTGIGGMQIFSASGTFTVPAGVTKVKVTVIGAGGGCNTSARCSGGGGGAAIKLLSGLTPGGTLTVTIGSLGSNTSGSIANRGGTGGTSSVSSGTSNTITTISATGGGGGSGTASETFGLGGLGSNGDFNVRGTPGLQSQPLYKGEGGYPPIDGCSPNASTYYNSSCTDYSYNNPGSGFGIGSFQSSAGYMAGAAGGVIFEW